MLPRTYLHVLADSRNRVSPIAEAATVSGSAEVCAPS
jgi:hypothetical protein